MTFVPPQTVYRYFNDYLQTEEVRTSDIDIDTATFEALGHAGYTGHLVERARKAVQAANLVSYGFYNDIARIVSLDLLAPVEEGDDE